MIVDLAHCSHACFADVMRLAARPVVVSHGGVKATCNTNRNLTDDELRQLARNGGVIGIGYWDAAVCAPTPAATARAIVHAIQVAGVDHVGLGTRFRRVGDDRFRHCASRCGDPGADRCGVRATAISPRSWAATSIACCWRGCRVTR